MSWPAIAVDMNTATPRRGVRKIALNRKKHPSHAAATNE